MKRVLKKLRGNAGESIAETLVALLISALALVMLAGAVSAASNIISKSNEKMNEYYADSGAQNADWYVEINKNIR